MQLGEVLGDIGGTGVWIGRHGANVPPATATTTYRDRVTAMAFPGQAMNCPRSTWPLARRRSLACVGDAVHQ